MNQQIVSMVTVTGEYCAFFPEELSQLEHLIGRRRKEEFPLSLSLNVMLLMSPRARECDLKSGKQAPRSADDI